MEHSNSMASDASSGPQITVDDDSVSTPKGTAIAHADALDTRLQVLQSLLPDGAKIRKEEVVDAALEYIRCLEQRIKILESYVADIDIACQRGVPSRRPEMCGRHHG